MLCTIRGMGRKKAVPGRTVPLSIGQFGRRATHVSMHSLQNVCSHVRICTGLLGRSRQIPHLSSSTMDSIDTAPVSAGFKTASTTVILFSWRFFGCGRKFVPFEGVPFDLEFRGRILFGMFLRHYNNLGRLLISFEVTIFNVISRSKASIE